MSISVRNISKTFGGTFKALDNVSLEVPTGELVALLGPSGSGKTTLLRIIAGLETCDTGATPGGAGGTIDFHGEDVADRHVRERQVGFVFQHYALFRHMTVFQNIAFGLKVRPRRTRPGKAEIRERVFKLLKLVQLEALADRLPNQLSGGQRQRVALARALAVEPKVLLLDEPFGALDAKVRQELRAWLRRLHDEIHVTSVFVTHDQDEALEVADRVVVMNHGRIEQVGSPDEVFHHPQTEFVMSFLGNVNRFHGRVQQGKVEFANLSLDASSARVAADGASAKVFVRPYELDIAKAPNGHPTLKARVLRIHSAGSVVRVEMTTDAGEPLHAEISQDRYLSLALTRGDTVHVTPRGLRVFAEDYAI